MKYHRVLLLAVAAVIGGCGEAYWGPAIAPDQTAQSLSGILDDRRASELTVSANLTLVIKGRVGSVNLNHKLSGEGVFMKDRARANFKKGPISALNVLSVGDELTVYLPWTEKAYEGDVVKLLTEQGDLPKAFHLDPLTFFAPVIIGKVRQYDHGPKHDIIDTDLGQGFWMRYIVLASTGVMVTADLIDPEGKVMLRKNYERYTEVNGIPVASLVSFAAPRSGVKGFLRMARINLAPTVRESAFTMKIPPEIKVEVIEKKQAEKSDSESGS